MCILHVSYILDIFCFIVVLESGCAFAVIADLKVEIDLAVICSA
jgi:hypothetical protein